MSDHSFARVRLFLLALLNSLERLQELLGKQWPDLRSRLLGLLGELLDEFQENRLPARVNRICRAFDGTEAEPFVRGLFREANGKTLPSTTAGFLYHDGDRSTVADSRSRDIDALHSLGTDAEATPLAATAEDLREAARGFARALAGAAAGVEANATDHESVPPAAHATDTTVTAHPQLRGDDQAYVDEPYRFQVKLSDQPQPGGPYLAVPEMAIPVAPGETVKKLQVKLSAPATAAKHGISQTCASSSGSMVRCSVTRHGGSRYSKIKRRRRHRSARFPLLPDIRSTSAATCAFRRYRLRSASFRPAPEFI